MKERLLILLIIVRLTSSLRLNPKVIIGQISNDTSIRAEDEITDSYQEMLNDPSKKLISLDIQNEGRLNLSQNIVIENNEGIRQFSQKDRPKGLSYYTGTLDKD